jgi:hypothetical protein
LRQRNHTHADTPTYVTVKGTIFRKVSSVGNIGRPDPATILLQIAMASPK